LQREATRGVKPNIHDGERLTHKMHNILKNLERKNKLTNHLC